MQKNSLAALLALAALAIPASAKTYYVKPTGADVDPKVQKTAGLSEGAAFKTIQFAIDKAPAGSTILVYPGEYQAINSNNKKLTITAVEGPNKTVITGFDHIEEHDGYYDVVPADENEEDARWDEDKGQWVKDEWIDDPWSETIYAPVVARLGGWGNQAVYATINIDKYSNGSSVKYYYDSLKEKTVYLSVPKGWLDEWGYLDPPDGVHWVSWRESGSRKIGTALAFKGGKNTVLEGFTLENGPRAAWGGTVKFCVVRDIDNGLIDFDDDFETGFCKESQWGANAAVYQSSLSDCTIADNTNTPVDTRSFDSAGGFVHGCTLVRCTIEDNVNVDIGDSTLFCTLLAGNAMDVDLDSGSIVGTLVYGSDLYNCTVASNAVGNYTMDVAEWNWTTVPADENDEDAWEENGEWFKEIRIRGEWNRQETTEDDEDGWYSNGKYYKYVFVPYENDTDGIETGPNVAVSWCNVYDSVVWGNVDGDGNPANVRLDRDVKTGETVARDYMNYTGEEEDWETGEPQTYEWKAWNSMMNSLVEDILVEQKGNNTKKGYKNSTGNITGDPLFIDPENGDFHLAPQSPCVNAGADYTKKTGKFDLDSAARKVGKVDMGAYELQPNVAVPADYDGDGITDPAFFFASAGQWWIFGSDSEPLTISLPDVNATPCPADYDGDGKAEPAYFTAAAKTPEFVRIDADNAPIRKTFGAKGATPVAVRFPDDSGATFGFYTANAKKPAFSFVNGTTATIGTKASRPVVAKFDDDDADDFGVYTATASKPAFSILQSSEDYLPANLFQKGPVALGPKGAIPCCADFDGDGAADFGVYMSNTKDPYFQRLFSTAKFKETRTLPIGNKGDTPVVGVYETAFGPAAPAIWTGSKWTYVDSGYWDVDLLGN